MRRGPQKKSVSGAWWETAQSIEEFSFNYIFPDVAECEWFPNKRVERAALENILEKFAGTGYNCFEEDMRRALERVKREIAGTQEAFEQQQRERERQATRATIDDLKAKGLWPRGY